MMTCAKTKTRRLAFSGAALLTTVAWLPAGSLRADADGPDFYRVTGVASSDVLHIRAEPNADAAKLGDIPHDGNCVRNLGCKGGLTFEEFTTLGKVEQAERVKANPRWCKVEYKGIVGWVAGRYLAEGDCN